MKEVSLFDVAEETYIDRLNCEIRQPFYDFMAENDLDLHVACSSPREDWIQAMVMRGLGVSVMPQFSIITQRIGWRKLVGPLSNCRQISIARAEGLSPQPSAEEFFSDATEFQWEYALDVLEKRAGLS
jgi:LysR family hydrogen peroxide-inducible transcriptional activator